MALRETVLTVIYAQRQLRTEHRLTAKDIATSLAPYVIDQTEMSLPLCPADTRRFVSEFARWLDILHED